MANAVMILTRTASTDIDAYNRVAVSATDIPNGGVMLLNALSTTKGQGEVFTATAPTANATGLWMAYSPEVVSIVTATGAVYRGLDVDPRNFTNIKGVPFDVFKPVVGDLIEITADGVGGTAPTLGQFVVANTTNILQGATSAPANGFAAKVLAVKTMTIANGKIAQEGVKSYLLEVIAN